MSDAICHPQGFLFAGIGQKGGEFLAANSSDKIASAYARLNGFCNHQQCDIALTMAVGVVDLLEVVGIDDEQCAAIAVPTLGFQCCKKCFAVQEARHVIMARLFGKPYMGVFQFRMCFRKPLMGNF